MSERVLRGLSLGGLNPEAGAVLSGQGPRRGTSKGPVCRAEAGPGGQTLRYGVPPRGDSPKAAAGASLLIVAPSPWQPGEGLWLSHT